MSMKASRTRDALHQWATEGFLARWRARKLLARHGLREPDVGRPDSPIGPLESVPHPTRRAFVKTGAKAALGLAAVAALSRTTDALHSGALTTITAQSADTLEQLVDALRMRAHTVAQLPAPSIATKGRMHRVTDSPGLLFIDNGYEHVSILGARWNVRVLGAIMDGNSHPLSQRYATLGAAQADYPHVTSLTQEIDWAASQLALNLAATYIGSTVELPVGSLTLVSDGLSAPEGVNVQGDKMGKELTTGSRIRAIGTLESALRVVGSDMPEGATTNTHLRHDVNLRDLSIACGANVQNGIYAQNVDSLVLDNVRTAGAAYGLHLVHVGPLTGGIPSTIPGGAAQGGVRVIGTSMIHGTYISNYIDRCTQCWWGPGWSAGPTGGEPLYQFYIVGSNDIYVSDYILNGVQATGACVYLEDDAQNACHSIGFANVKMAPGANSTGDTRVFIRARLTNASSEEIVFAGPRWGFLGADTFPALDAPGTAGEYLHPAIRIVQQGRARNWCNTEARGRAFILEGQKLINVNLGSINRGLLAPAQTITVTPAFQAAAGMTFSAVRNTAVPGAGASDLRRSRFTIYAEAMDAAVAPVGGWAINYLASIYGS